MGHEIDKCIKGTWGLCHSIEVCGHSSALPGQGKVHICGISATLFAQIAFKYLKSTSAHTGPFSTTGAV